MRQDTRPDCKHHCCCKSDRQRVARGTPDAAMHISKCSPDTHRSSHDQPCISQTDKSGKTWMDALRLGVPLGPFCETQCKSDRYCANSKQDRCRLGEAGNPKSNTCHIQA